MLTVHHLNQSRSQRVLWALEELNLPYQIVRYQRGADMLAPDTLKKIHPLGKSPIVEDNGHVIAESGAILEYLQDIGDPDNRFKPQDPDGKLQYRFWLHYAEGSLMSIMMIKLVLQMLGKSPVPLGLRTVGKVLGTGVQKAWLNNQIATHASFIESHLAKTPWFAGDELSMADIQMSFPLFALLSRGGLSSLPNITAWKARVEARPAWQQAIEKGGPFSLPGE
ncbi:glutathione S-transferase family protein [Pseudocitrobacter cyperus]|uniref:Glutathione S-transferase n=1 Tax=Pseudocitrobacter cyperus TaxID=3112843 RepID=A0ABV0HPV5_9ENTR